MRDFRASPPPTSVDLIVGSAFADLFPPADLVSSLLRFAAPSSSPLLYFPITYAGMTVFDVMDASGPGDVEGLRLYNDALRERGHSLEPEEVRRGGLFVYNGHATCSQPTELCYKTA